MPRKPHADAKTYETFTSLGYKKHAGKIKAGLKLQVIFWIIN